VVRRVSPILIHQFDICRLGSRVPSRAALLVVVLQHDELDDLATLIVAPLLGELPSEARPRLHPEIWLDGSPAYLFVDRMSAVRRSEIGAVVGSAQGAAWAIKRAIDTVFFGF
jgi:hypothetical protein